MSETKSGYVQGKRRTKSGKSWSLQIDGKWTSVSNRANMDGVDQGVYVVYELGGWQSSEGWVPSIERIKPAQAPAGSAPPTSGSGTNAAPSRLQSAYWDDSALRFISNVVGCAITSGKCDIPGSCLHWAMAAQDCLVALKGIQGPAQTSGNGGPSRDTSGSAPREPGQDDEPFFDDSDDLRFT